MSLTSSDLAALSRLLDDALEMPKERVEAWLQTLPDADVPFVAQLREMLKERAEGGSTSFLAEGPRLSEALDDGAVAHRGDLVGPYRLIREVGRGGMGTVWLAERADGTLRRSIALKLPRLSWDSGLADRMARERDIGALLTHPHIARLYDAGLDDRGRPFLALEFIDGVAVDEWCRTQSPPIRARLELFNQIVHAVAYAHGRLVVHRDLKPSNVLVTPDGQAHLLDFGIAKLLDGADPNLTQDQGRLLTPRYASPEQLSGQTITVSSDIYSLGVLLYELLTGQSPYSAERGTPAALEAAILEGEPPLASIRVTDKALGKQMKGELDAILAKALKRDPSQRYATADALADDIARHLTGKRVIAQPDRLAYRARRMLRRHRTAIASIASVILAVMGGAAVSLVQAQRANHAAERAQTVKDFVVDIFKVNSRTSPENDVLRQLPAELLLERGAELVKSKFAGKPDLQSELYGVVAGIFSDMGAHAKGATYAAMRIETLAAYDAPVKERIQALLMLTRELCDDGRLADAEVRVARARELADDEASVVEAEITWAHVSNRLLLYNDADRHLRAAEAALTLHPSLSGAMFGDAAAERAIWLSAMNRFDEALPKYEEAIKRHVMAEGAGSRDVSKLRIALAYDLAGHGRSEEAKTFAERAFTEMRRVAGSNDFATALVEADLAAYMFMNGGIPYADANEAITRSKAMLERSSQPIPERLTASVNFQLGYARARWGDLQSGYPLMARAFPVLRSEAHSTGAVFRLIAPFGMYSAIAGRHAEAAALLSERLDIERLPGRASSPFSVPGYIYAAWNEQMQGRFESAQAILDSAPLPPEIRGAKNVGPDGYRNLLLVAKASLQLDRGRPEEALALLPDSAIADEEVQVVRGAVECALHRPSNGLPLMEVALGALMKDHYAHDPVIARWQSLMGLCALSDGKRPKAIELAASAHAAFAAQPNVSPYFKVTLAELDRRLGKG